MSYDDFKCPIELCNHDAVCPECIFMKPITFGYGYHLPHKKHTSNPIFIEDVSFCEEWYKKEYDSACGCGGTITCECGYITSFCFLYKGMEMCPFCKKTCKIDYAIPYNIDLTNYNTIFIKKEVNYANSNT